MNEQQTLARTISLPLLALYGLGTILGAGIYVLVGKVAGSAGFLAPLSFLVAAVIAWVTALSYAQMSVLFPKSAGEAIYVQNAFNMQWLSYGVGTLIVLTGIVSSATLVKGFVGYLQVLVPVDEIVVIILLVMLLGMIAAWGISESLKITAAVTLLEISGLVLVILVRGDSLVLLPSSYDKVFLPSGLPELVGILSGAFIAFYAFIGFEDMVNVVEEVKEPEKTMPRAIFLAVFVSGLLYMLIAVIAVLSEKPEVLSASDAPLSLLVEDEHVFGSKILAVFGVFAVVNGILIQIIMASRVVYGLSGNTRFFHLFSAVNTTTRTPVNATILICVLILVFSLALPLVSLAKVTSFVVLVIFSLVNLALWWVKRMDEYRDLAQLKTYPILGLVLCVGMLGFQLFDVFSQIVP